MDVFEPKCFGAIKSIAKTAVAAGVPLKYPVLGGEDYGEVKAKLRREQRHTKIFVLFVLSKERSARDDTAEFTAWGDYVGGRQYERPAFPRLLHGWAAQNEYQKYPSR
jgi:hypothetical protein